MLYKELAAKMENNKMKKNDVYTKEIYLINPWSGAVSATTWEGIVEFCRNNVHPNNKTEWMRIAYKAVREDNALLLGSMIIGS
jgi:hypothetical protein